jgi:hypothetical protein
MPGLVLFKTGRFFNEKSQRPQTNVASVNVDDDGILTANTPLVHSINETEVAIPF